MQDLDDKKIEIYEELDMICLMSRMCRTVLLSKPEVLENDYIDKVYKELGILMHGDVELVFEDVIKRCDSVSEMVERLNPEEPEEEE